MRTETDIATARRIRTGVAAYSERIRAERAGLLTLTQTAVLGQVYRHGAMTPGEIADRLRAKPQTLTRVLAALEERALISRTPDPADGRQALVTITDAGRATLRDEMHPRDVFGAALIAQELTEEERDLLTIAARLLERLAAAGDPPVRAEP
ncbi:MarR family transcriptional regulator [Asanoa ishikariensis]|uniref:DNA-binding transcriptional regulator, MarR family n=1 Tax=Asanoa ishikariensis TaxID=137265 RepID=A0A1H3S460_9ACTN|nr:MarR family transcriptional regulator [Asanoa ishikariensis]GIF66579.1 MarR family transcriptional regulator [Asanoa ishikariensis]SDZ31949.1 DNA-binding transcriptional regulator, MarR family [Asanoa ishikariensis]